MSKYMRVAVDIPHSDQYGSKLSYRYHFCSLFLYGVGRLKWDSPLRNQLHESAHVA